VTEVFLWQAGTAEGVADQYMVAQVRAYCFMRTTGASTAVVEQAALIDGGASMDSRYAPVPGHHWVGCRRPGGRMSWKQQPLKVSALTAALRAGQTTERQDISRDGMASS
jgi:hypothetical protein